MAKRLYGEDIKTLDYLVDSYTPPPQAEIDKFESTNKKHYVDNRGVHGRPRGVVQDTWTPAELKNVFLYALCGCSNREIGSFLGVSEDKVRYWCKSRPAFAEAVYKGRQGASNKVVRSLYKCCLGYTTEEVTRIEGTSPKGEPYNYTRTVTKHVPPNPRLIMFFLINKDRSHWTDSQKIEISGMQEGDVTNVIDLENLTPAEKKLYKSIAIKQMASFSGTSKN